MAKRGWWVRAHKQLKFNSVLFISRDTSIVCHCDVWLVAWTRFLSLPPTQHWMAIEHALVCTNKFDSSSILAKHNSSFDSYNRITIYTISPVWFFSSSPLDFLWLHIQMIYLAPKKQFHLHFCLFDEYRILDMRSTDLFFFCILHVRFRYCTFPTQFKPKQDISVSIWCHILLNLPYASCIFIDIDTNVMYQAVFKMIANRAFYLCKQIHLEIDLKLVNVLTAVIAFCRLTFLPFSFVSKFETYKWSDEFNCHITNAEQFQYFNYLLYIIVYMYMVGNSNW